MRRYLIRIWVVVALLLGWQAPDSAESIVLAMPRLGIGKAWLGMGMETAGQVDRSADLKAD